ncbi:MAG: hypothetical protein QF706_05485, partial [Roseibacillus sp.]|nr:hypothetical protein [Roseibacillus sp.]
MKRRTFVQSGATAALSTGVTQTGWAIPAQDGIELEKDEAPTDLYAACPYCGVGCGTILKTRNGR